MAARSVMDLVEELETLAVERDGVCHIRVVTDIVDHTQPRTGYLGRDGTVALID